MLSNPIKKAYHKIKNQFISKEDKYNIISKYLHGEIEPSEITYLKISAYEDDDMEYGMLMMLSCVIMTDFYIDVKMGRCREDEVPKLTILIEDGYINLIMDCPPSKQRKGKSSDDIFKF